MGGIGHPEHQAACQQLRPSLCVQPRVAADRSRPLMVQVRTLGTARKALVAQLVEHLICNQGVGSSSLSGGTNIFNVLAG